MKKGVSFVKIIVLAFMFIIGGTACMKKPSDSMINSQTSELAVLSDRQIVEGVWNELQGTDSVFDGEGVDYIGEDMKLAEALLGKLFGSITSEAEAKEKGRTAIIELNGVLYGSTESENEMYKQSFEAKFYEEYSVWLINSTLPSGIDEQGRYYDIPGSVPYVIMRELDGKVLAFGIF